MGESRFHSRSCTGRDVLCVFGDFDEEFADAVFQGVDAQTTQHRDHHELFTRSLEAWADDWTALIECAKSMRQLRDINLESIDGSDVLTFAWEILRLNGVIAPPETQPWQETDRLIALAKRLEQLASKGANETETELRPWQETDRLIAVAKSLERQEDKEEEANITSSSELLALPGQTLTPRKRVCKAIKSHYWLEETQDRITAARGAAPKVSQSHANLDRSTLPSSNLLRQQQVTPTEPTASRALITAPTASPTQNTADKNPLERRKRANDASPYFSTPRSPRKAPAPGRPPAGMVSCMPFPPLTSLSFGLIQEKLAHEPFWLLVAVTFLIRTKGTAAIPVFYAVKERFPALGDLADDSNAAEILGMIRHLGLSTHRLRFLQRYSRAFTDNPPRAGKVYRVRNYDHRELDSSHRNQLECTETGMLTPNDDNEEDADAWEIGHMTQGKYAIDSWRIFCRDVLLGRAEDWNGKGREPEFQPEWMRVRPDDKELRACLRWMWMREGWEWNPFTGEKTVLRSVMQNAVNEGRIGYDDVGGLVILDDVLHDR